MQYSDVSDPAPCVYFSWNESKSSKNKPPLLFSVDRKATFSLTLYSCDISRYRYRYIHKILRHLTVKADKSTPKNYIMRIKIQISIRMLSSTGYSRTHKYRITMTEYLLVVLNDPFAIPVSIDTIYSHLQTHTSQLTSPFLPSHHLTSHAVPLRALPILSRPCPARRGPARGLRSCRSRTPSPLLGDPAAGNAAEQAGSAETDRTGTFSLWW